MAPLDPDFATLLGASGATSARGSQGPIGGAFDPSAGGGTLQFANLDTGIKTPQWMDRTLAGAGHGLASLVRHGANLVGAESDQDLNDAKALDAPLMNTTAGKIGDFIGTSAALAPLGMGAGAALGRMGAMGARLAASPIASGAVQGAAQGALLADPGQRLQGAGLGAVFGGGVPAVGKAIGTMANGITRSPAAQTLIDAGVKGLTPGQLNPGGMANRMEQALEGTPFIGDAVQGAREGAMQDYNRMMVERSMAPGAKLSPGTHDFNDMVDQAYKSFDTAYDAGKGFPVGAKIVNQTGPDVPLSQALKSTIMRAQPGISSQEQASIGKNLQDLLSQQVKDARQNGGMQSDDLFSLRSQIRDLIRGENGVDNSSRARRAIYQNAADKVTQALDSQLPQQAMQAVNEADQQYGKFAIIRNAAKAAKDAPGGPTRYQISSAIAKATPPNTYATGGGNGRDLSKAATETFQSNVPRTGLAGVGRLAIPAAAAYLGKGLALAHPVGAAIAAAPLAGMAAMTLTPAGRALAAGQTALQRAMARGLGNAQGMIPQQMQNLPQLGAQSALISLLGPRLQSQMPTVQPGQ